MRTAFASHTLSPSRWARRGLAALALALAAAHPTHAQLGAGGAVPPAEKLVRARAAPIKIAAGGSARATVTIAIEPGWHINANPPSPDYMIATKIELEPGFGVTPGTPSYPLGRALKVEFDEQPIAVYDHAATIRVPLTAALAAASGRHALKGRLRFQACVEG